MIRWLLPGALCELVPVALVGWLMACAPQPLHLEVTPVNGGVDVSANRPLERVELYTSAGELALTRRLDAPTDTVFLPTPTEGRSFRIVVFSGAETSSIDAQFPSIGSLMVEIEAPVGQGRRPIADGDVVGLIRVEGSALSVGILLTALAPTTGVVELGSHRELVSLDVAGERVLVTLPLDDSGDIPLRIQGAGWEIKATVRPEIVSEADARESLRVTETRFPTDIFGSRDHARPADRITLPAAWWRRVLRSLGLGYRPIDDQAPWAWQAITLHNARATDVDIVLRATVTDRAGPVEAFRSQVRTANSDAVSTLLRVPAGASATAVLPVFARGKLLPHSGRYTRIIEVLPLGSERPLHRVEAPLYVTRGNPWASLGFALAVLTSLGGYLLLWLRGGVWFREMRTSDLVTVSMFGSLTFVVATTLQVLGMGVAAVLGPFSPLLMGLADDAFRACLLGTLIALLPRPGVAALATIIGFLMRGLTLGAFHPVDLLYVGSAVLWLEGWLWLSGCTRGAGWLQGSRTEQWIRLSVGLGLSNLCATATGLAISVVLYRLFLADWYVALILALPGFLYVLIGTWLAVDFADALRKVSS
jgi:hypothetical protein